MSKYLLLIILNTPFILYGIVKAIIYFKESVYSWAQLTLRLAFWLTALTFVVFAQPIYNFLVGNDLTNSTPLSLADVLLATFSFLSFTLIIRLYARLEKAEHKISALNEELSLKHAAGEKQST